MRRLQKRIPTLGTAAMLLALAGCDPSASDVCGEPSEGNGDVPPSFPIEMGRNAGTFEFSYETRNAKDRIEVFYEGTLLFDSGCVGESRRVQLAYGPGSSTQVDVVVSPKCEGSPATSWKFQATCPAPNDVFTQSVVVGEPENPPRR